MPSLNSSKTPFHILLADDDRDDCFFFKEALSKQTIPTELSTVDNGEKLMTYLSRNIKKLPDVVFLDLNMPRKNGADCLREIKQDERLQDLPVIIYSTYLHKTVADQLYKNGAHYYVKKGDLPELRNNLKHLLSMMKENKFDRPGRDNFILSTPQA